MKIIEDKDFPKKAREIHDTIAEIRIKTEQSVILFNDLCRTYTHKCDGNQDDLGLAEKQITSLYEEAESLFRGIDDNRKKLAELIKANNVTSSGSSKKFYKELPII